MIIRGRIPFDSKNKSSSHKTEWLKVIKDEASRDITVLHAANPRLILEILYGISVPPDIN